MQVSELDNQILVDQSAMKYFPQYSYVSGLFLDLGFWNIDIKSHRDAKIWKLCPQIRKYLVSSSFYILAFLSVSSDDHAVAYSLNFLSIDFLINHDNICLITFPFINSSVFKVWCCFFFELKVLCIISCFNCSGSFLQEYHF